MKKIAVFTMIVAAMCCAGMVKAQRPVGDTIFGVDSTYYYYIYNWYYDDSREWSVYSGEITHHAISYNYTDSNHTLTPPGENLNHWLCGNAIYGVQMHTDRPLKVAGIAAPAYMMEARDTGYINNGHLSPSFCLNVWDTTMAGRATDSMILYKPVDGSLVKLMDGPWRMENPHRHIVLPPRRYAWNSYEPRSFEYIDSSATCYIAPLYEVMFEKPIVVEDSFVVAITTFNNEGHWGWVYDQNESPRFMWLWDHCLTRMFSFWEMRDDETPENIVWHKYRTANWWRTSDFLTLSGRYQFTAPVVFPIIDPGFDTTLCHEVSNLRVAERGAGSATLMWDAGDGGPWIVAYGKVDDAWEDFTFDTVGSPMVTLTGLEVGTQYFALVRGYCSVTGEYGEWTSPLEVEIFQPGHQEPEGIEHPGDLGRFTRLVPNPARGEVNVVSSFRLSRIELYALDGRKVLEQEADGISTMVDVSSLPRGTYIAALYLPHGVATKKLVKN
ncbi:MAG: T9SS type A sorting domain-containing protein [Bacteroidales bacterium]|nr:T9SS type A sorting domain-containing protein [Bacteroidales bacterium]